MIGDLLKSIFGDKTAKDRKEYWPFVEKAKTAWESIQHLSDDQLREKTRGFQEQIRQSIAPLEATLEALHANAADTQTSFEEKEKRYEEIDQMVKTIDERIEEELLVIMPEAFAVVKETARRWAENGQLTVSATALDREIAANRDGITIDDDRAIWHNEWTAAGNKIQWAMVHYDVQLMGGAVLHRGNIAEMQTGEGKTLVATLPVYLNALSGKGVHIVTVNDYLAKRDAEWMGPLYEFHGLRVDCIDKHQPNSQRRRQAYLADITFGTNNEFGFDYLRDNMAGNVDDIVQRKHHFAIVDEVDSVLIDDARTPLIIAGPTPKGDEHEFHELKPRIERVVEAQKAFVQQCLNDAKKMLSVINEPNPDKNEQKRLLEEGGIALLRAHRGLPKNRSLIKFLSEPGIRVHLQKTENFYMAEQGKQMKKIDVDLFFVIDEKNNSIELTDKGIDLVSGKEDRDFFIMPDIGAEIAKLQKEKLEKDAYLERKDTLVREYSIKSERIHSVSQLLRAYTLFEKEVEYVIMDGKVKIVDESTGRIMEGRRYSDGLHQAIEAKENVTVEAATQTYASITLQNYFRMYHKLAGMTGTAETEGRPVLVGTTTVEISELLSRMLQMKKIQHQVLNAKYHQKEAEIVANAGKAGTVTIATNMAGRGTDIKLGEGVIEAGGLAIIGTERHDSRRVDRQLRGRAGRQGDPGSSRFFVSLEDDLMRKFGSERIASIMDRMGLKEGEVITAGMVSKSIERAQKKVEENNFGMRKNLLEYDDVMNSQRKAIYRKRRNALYGDRLDIDIDNMFFDLCENTVAAYSKLPFHEFELELLRLIGIETPVDEATFNQISTAELTEKVYATLRETYDRKCDKIARMAFPQVKHVFETMSQQYKNIVFPLTDGRRQMQLIVNLEEAYQSEGRVISKYFERNVLLSKIDDEWKEHLREMDDLRSAVRNAQYEQKDPLVIYKLESYELFRSMLMRLNEETLDLLMRMDVPLEQQIQSTNQEDHQNNYDKAQTSNQEAIANSAPAAPPIEKKQPVVAQLKINRNDPCPCGSGKKFKQCHGQ